MKVSTSDLPTSASRPSCPYPTIRSPSGVGVNRFTDVLDLYQTTLSPVARSRSKDLYGASVKRAVFDRPREARAGHFPVVTPPNEAHPAGVGIQHPKALKIAWNVRPATKC